VTEAAAPTLDEISALREKIRPYVDVTPVWQWKSERLAAKLPGDTRVTLKLELFQRTGSFKPRGALSNILDMDEQALKRGVTAISAGNHAIGVAYAARVLGTTAKVVMPKTVSPVRLERAREYGAEVILVDDVHEGFDLVTRIERDEGRRFVHPFEGPFTARGTATLGAEFIEQTPGLDAVIVPVGGGGLIGGIAAALKQLKPSCEVYGVEPEGADTTYRSFRSGEIEKIDKVRTIADSLGSPYSAPYSLALCRRFADDIVLVNDDDLCRSMALMFNDAKLAVEPAAAAGPAALLGPLRDRLAGKHVGIVVCGANIDHATFASYLERGVSASRGESAA
jgi:threonine dehydratase